MIKAIRMIFFGTNRLVFHLIILSSFCIYASRNKRQETREEFIKRMRAEEKLMNHVGLLGGCSKYRVKDVEAQIKVNVRNTITLKESEHESILTMEKNSYHQPAYPHGEIVRTLIYTVTCNNDDSKWFNKKTCFFEHAFDSELSCKLPGYLYNVMKHQYEKQKRKAR